LGLARDYAGARIATEAPDIGAYQSPF
jgi:hypothetical protein